MPNLSLLSGSSGHHGLLVCSLHPGQVASIAKADECGFPHAVDSPGIAIAAASRSVRHFEGQPGARLRRRAARASARRDAVHPSGSNRLPPSIPMARP
jgi:hypothetical protein